MLWALWVRADGLLQLAAAWGGVEDALDAGLRW